MIFRQLFDRTSCTYSYLLASGHGREALIIDPVIERVDHYLRLLAELQLSLVKAIDTHVHADHITGLPALRDKTRCVTVMGEQTKADVVSIRVCDGDFIDLEGLRLQAIYTPGHTDDSYSFRMDDRVFTGDTLLIRGTGRTDFQNGDARAQYDSIFNKLLKLPPETLVYPGHDYKGDTVSTIAEERDYNPRLQVDSVDEYAEIMANLSLPNPKMMDVAVPANLKVGLSQDDLEGQGWSVSPQDAAQMIGQQDVVLVDLRDANERVREGVIRGSVHTPYSSLQENVEPGGLLHELAATTDRQLVFYCAYGERSAMAVQSAREQGIGRACHIKGGLDAWKKADLPTTRISAPGRIERSG
jgi:glyoxylase-like metal-dependent hydrolase (beta-lactamase superfamily II)/rhodanese-related sulfurtransferase